MSEKEKAQQAAQQWLSAETARVAILFPPDSDVFIERANLYGKVVGYRTVYFKGGIASMWVQVEVPGDLRNVSPEDLEYAYTAEAHFKRFETLSTTQQMGVSNKLDLDTFTTWVDESAADPRPLRKFLVYFEEGADAIRVEMFVYVIEERLDVEVEVITEVPSAEIQQMIALANKINNAH